jgi:hypothetical protein
VSFHDIGKDLFNLADTLFNMYRELQVLFWNVFLILYSGMIKCFSLYTQIYLKIGGSVQAHVTHLSRFTHPCGGCFWTSCLILRIGNIIIHVLLLNLLCYV